MKFFIERRFAVLGLASLAAMAYAAFAIWQAARATRDARQLLASEAEVRFTSARLDRPAPVGFEWISSPAVFRDARRFQGRLYLCGPAGLFEYDTSGKLLARYRVGLELPAAPLVALEMGVSAEASAPELLIATAGEGLIAFDGRGFRQIRPEEAPYRRLTALLPLASGRILLGTEKKGLLVYDGKRTAPFHPALSGLHVTALAGDEGSLWVGTLDRGVLHWHAGQLDRFGEAEGLPDVQVLSLAVEGEAAYAGTPMGVAEFQSGRFVRVLAEGFFAKSLLARADKLIIGTLEDGTIELGLNARPNRAPRPRSEPLPRAVERLINIDGTLYAVAEDGLYAIDPYERGWARAPLEPESAVLADRNITALAVEKSGRLWIGYFDRGLDIVEPGGSRASHLEDEHVFCVNRVVLEPQRGGAAVATANGLALFDASGKLRRLLGRSEGLISNHVTDVLLGPGAMIAATPAGLTFIDPAGARSLYAFHGLVNNHVYALAASGDRLLAGTLGGLSILDGGVVRASYTTANSAMKHNYVTAIVSVGDEWFVGTYGRGILRLDSSGHWHTFADASGAFEVNQNAMAVTAGRVYAGTLGRGLYVYDRESGRWGATTAGLPSVNVTAIAAHDGFLYIGTDNGLVRCPERNF